MSQLDDQGKPDQPAGGALKLRASIAFLLAMLAVAGGYYFLYYKPRSASLAARDFRILATLGHQVRKVVEGEGKVLNSLDRIQPLDGLTMAETLQQAPKLLGLTVHELHADGPDHEVCPPGLGKVSQTLEPTPDGEGQRLESDFACAGRTTLHSRRPLDEVLEPLFLSRLASEAFDPSRRAFDALLLADETGQWIYQPGHQGLPAMSVPRLDVLLLTAHPPLWAGAGKNAGAAPGSRLQAAMGSSQRFDIEIDGQSFALFVQPVPMPTLGVGKTGTQDHQPPKWLLCGLLSHEEITSQGLAVTPSYLAAAVAMLLLALFSWPLLKFKLHGERQRVRLVHLLMAALCSLLGISLVTLLLLDLYHHHQLERQSDRQVQALASRLEMNLEREVRKAYCQLVALESAATTSFVKSNAARPDPHRMRWDQVWDPRETIKGQVEPYPYWTDFALVDREGEQRLKWANGGLRSLRVNVAARSYFKSARDDVGLWRLPAWDRRRAAASGEVADCVPRDDPGKFRLESVVSLIRGVRQAQLSKPAARPLSADLDGRYSVATLTLPMLSTIRPVVPFGFTFMVVADDETREDVLFHLHPERNLSEDLFDETDRDPRLRSALRARHPATLDLRYEGEAFRASLVPIRGLPWTVVALQARGPVETANLLGVLTAAVLLLLYVGAFALVLSAIALVRPGYRAGWLWPARERANDYLRLILVYTLLCVAFTLAALLLPGGGQLAGVAWLLPLLALVLGHFQLTRRRWRGPRKVLVVASGVLFLGVVLGALLTPFEAGPVLRDAAGLAVLAAAFLVYVHPRGWARLTRRIHVPISLAYPAVGLLLLALTAVLPTVCFFKTAQAIQTDCFIKHGQLELARDLERRPARAAETSALYPLAVDRRNLAPAVAQRDGSLVYPADRSLDFYGQAFFGTQLARFGRDDKGERQNEAETWPGLLEVLLPAYSSYAVEIRDLLRDEATGGDWRWERVDDQLQLRTSGLGGSAGAAYALVSQLPPTSPLAASRPGSAGRGAVAVAGAALFAILLLGLLWGLAIFVSRHLFLIDLFEPLWSGREGEMPATVGSNVFLISRHGRWRVPEHDRSFFRLDFKQLEEEAPGWASRILGVLSSVRDRNILLAGFEHRILEPGFNDQKLALLEDLVKDRTVVVLSTVSPTVLFARPEGGAVAPAASSGSEERWWALFACFTLIDDDLRTGKEASTESVTVLSLRRLRRILRRGRRPAAAAHERFDSKLLERECGTDPFLLQIGDELDSFASALDRRQLLEELGERAESYYRALWASCSHLEKVVVGHLAQDGLVNEKNRRLVRRLMVRGLIRRQPYFRLMNETFRLYVVSPECRKQVLRLEQTVDPSAWDRLRRPFFAVLVAAAVFFLGTQRQLLDSTTAMVGAFTAALPVLLKVADTLGARRGAANAK
ncbi:MAG TPA: hypothetical protein VN999_08575 [Thermoanaerobaculia bacterium]|nr:hypothetical protein [Thermoanaerobaculia bacterium]